MFTQSPRGWRTRVYEDSEFGAFRRAREKSGIDPVVVHAPYLPNLGTSDEAMYRKSLAALIADLARCEKLGADYLVIHPGAYSPDADLTTALDRIGAALNEALAAVATRTVVLIENMAGGGRRVGGAFSEIAEILKRVKQEQRVAVCFDTCHAFAAGNDVSSPAGVAAMLAEFDREIGADRIRVFHVNDSKGALGCRLDLHEHLGQGRIQEDGLRALLNHPAFRDRAFVLETPKEPAPEADLKNLARLRAYFR